MHRHPRTKSKVTPSRVETPEAVVARVAELGGIDASPAPSGAKQAVATAVDSAPLSACLASFALGAGIGALAIYAVGRGATVSEPFWARLGHQAWDTLAHLLPERVQGTLSAAKEWGASHGA